MKKSELFTLKLNESKDLLNHINDSIRETRNRLYFIIALMFAIFGYLVDDVLNSDYNSTKSILLYSLILFMLFIAWQCRKAITPLKLRFNGMSPSNFDKISSNEWKQTKINLFHTYQRSIEVNGEHLKMISKSYNKAYYAILIWILLVSVFFIFKWVIQCYI